MSNGPSNKRAGTSFEDIFSRQAQLQGFLVMPNHTPCRFIPGGRAIPIKGELDFKLIDQSGRVGFFDCKSFQEDFFTYSDLDEKQIERAVLYNEWSVPSGFVVYFRKTNQVYFYNGHVIDLKGPRERFDKSDGISLGTIFKFRPSIIMDQFK
jgi:hypothetical protein